MKELKEFNTLEEARAYSYTDYQPISAGVAGQFFGINGMLDALELNFANQAKVKVLPHYPETTVGALCRTVVKATETKGFATNPSEPDGYINREGAKILVTQGIFEQAMVDEFWKMGETIVTPYKDTTQQEFDESKDAGETISLPDNNTQHKITLAIATQPRQPTRITIQQCFGNVEEDLTEWHDVGSVTVFYKQRTYSTGMIPAAPAPIRHLRAVSPLTLGLSKV